MKKIFILLVALALPIAAGAQATLYNTSVEVEGRAGAGDPDRPVVTGEVRATATATTEQAGIEPDEIDVSASGSGEATASGYLKIGDIKGESTDNAEAKKGNVEYGWKVEEGESVADIEEEVIVTGATVRGWDEAQKAAIRTQAKSAANVNTRADLEVFAQAIALQNEAISEIEVDANEVAVARVRTGKLLGILPIQVQERIVASTELDSLGQVQVRLPWWRFLVKLDEESAAQEGIEQALEATIGNIEVGAQASAGASADTVPTEQVSLNFSKVSAQILLALSAAVSL